jgi:Phage integrase family
MANGWPGDDALVFCSEAGTPLDHSNTLRRVLRPAAKAVGVPWAGFHTFRHTTASMLFESGRNAVQVQRWLGHHSASFTLDTYIHLLPGEAEEPLNLATVLEGANKVQTEDTQPRPSGQAPTAEDSAQESEVSEPTQLHRSA